MYDEVNDLLPEEVNSSEEIDDILMLFGEQGIELIDSEERLQRKELKDEKPEELSREELNRLELSSGNLDKTNDPVRMYLREMGTVPLLNKEGEVYIARRIERGEQKALRALSRNHFIGVEVVRLGRLLRRNNGTSVDGILLGEDEESGASRRIAAITRSVTRIARLLRDTERLRRRLAGLKPGGRAHRRLAFQLGRARVRVGIEIREIRMSEALVRRFAAAVRSAADRM